MSTQDHQSSASSASGGNGADQHLFTNYVRTPIAFDRGEGCRLFDVDGREYVDFLAGLATSSLGHANPRLTAAISEQAARTLHVSNLFRNLK